ncbi:MAG TPA: hypothetical protein VFW96_09750 [Thermomicrobiales bacterium]|nr:hypothetical protein [Thermomicrobiales bacterium]
MHLGPRALPRLRHPPEDGRGRRRGHKRAVVAAGHGSLAIADHLLGTGQDYHDPGVGSFDAPDTARITLHHGQRLSPLGYEGIRSPQAAA